MPSIVRIDAWVRETAAGSIAGAAGMDAGTAGGAPVAAAAGAAAAGVAQLIVVGSGVTGAEFASAYNALGVDVVLVSSRHQVLPSEDADAGRVIQAVFEESGMTIMSSARVNLFLDLGRDTTAIWFHQYGALEHRFIDYLQDTGKTLDFYAREIQKKGYLLGNIYLPHDGGDKSVVTTITAESETKRLFPGVKVRIVPRVPDLMMGINAARAKISECYFHETNCAAGVECLENYRKKWSETIGNWSDEPVHDENSHPADAFQQFAQGWEVEHELNRVKSRHTIEFEPQNTAFGY